MNPLKLSRERALPHPPSDFLDIREDFQKIGERVIEVDKISLNGLGERFV